MAKFLVFVAVGLLTGAAKPDDPPKKDLDALQGTWKGVSAMDDGMAVPEELVKALQFIIKGDKYELKIQGQVMESGTLKIDASKKPTTVDFKIEKGEDAGKAQVGIYELKGDQVKFCLNHAGKTERPKEFTGAAGTGFGLFVLKRDKP